MLCCSHVVGGHLVCRYDRADQRERDRSRKRARQVDSDDEEVFTLLIRSSYCIT